MLDDRMMSEKKVLRAGIVGAGVMGRWHARAARRAGGKIVAVIDTNRDSARDFAFNNREVQAFRDLDEMLIRTCLDVVHICTPTASHLTIAEIALDAGLNVIVEKPMAPTGKDTERLLNLAADRSVTICPVHQFLFQDGVLKAREQLTRIGDLVHIESRIFSAGGMNCTRKEIDALVEAILPHPLSLMQLFLRDGLPQRDWKTIRPRAGELGATCEASGISLSIRISMSGRPTECSLTLAGSKGTMHLDLFHGYSFFEPGGVSKVRKILRPFGFGFRLSNGAAANLVIRILRMEPAYPGLRRLIGNFYEAVRSGSESPISPEDAISVARTSDSLGRSACLVTS